MDSFDLLIIGGGINGAAIARDAAIRGAKVLLVEKDDLAAHTSSASSKLIHGGLRYLEYYEFRLVREALREREMMLRTAPHIVRPLRFVLPHCPALRPHWMIRSGLLLYDLFSIRGSLPRSRRVGRREAGAPRPAQGAAPDPQLLGRLGRRQPADRAQRRRRRRAGRRDRDAHRVPLRPPRRRGLARRAVRRARGRREGDRQRRRPLGRRGSQQPPRRDQREPGPAGQGQPHRRPAPCGRASRPTSSSRPTAGSSSPCPSRATSP